MSTKVYLDLVRRPHGVGKGVLLLLQFPRMYDPVKNVCITDSNNTVINETESSGNITYLYYGS